MKYSLYAIGLVLAALAGCAPKATVSVEALERSDVARTSATPASPGKPQAPEPYVFFSSLEADDFVVELDRIAKLVHPRYRLSTRTVSFQSNNVARYLTTRLSNGVSRIIIWPFDEARLSRLRPIVDAFLEAGVVRESGLATLQPVPVPVLTVSSGGELFRFFHNTSRSSLLDSAHSCKSDYVINRERDALGSFGFDATVMPDGRTRLLVHFSVDRFDLARLAELQDQAGLVLACLESRVGASTAM